MAELNEPTIERPLYMETLARFKDSHIIKILSGVRRAGKTKILELYAEYLLAEGITPQQIIQRKYTSMELPETFTARDMYNDLKVAVQQNEKRSYLLLDEVQEIDGWEKAVNSIFEETNTDIYVTGSNSKLLSSEISTYLSGRFSAYCTLKLQRRRRIPDCGRHLCDSRHARYIPKAQHYEHRYVQPHNALCLRKSWEDLFCKDNF